MKTTFALAALLAFSSVDALAPKDKDVCWRDMYLRGVGKVESECAPGEVRSLGLCYPGCKDGFDGVGPLCYAGCPKDDPVSAGAVCCFSNQECTDKIVQLALQLPFDILKAYHDRTDPAEIIEDIKKAIEDALGFEMPTCAGPSVEEYMLAVKAQMDVVWDQVHNAVDEVALQMVDQLNVEDQSQVCWRDLYLRGLGKYAKECDDGQEKSLGLCYPTCHTGFSGEGPLCYAGCPDADSTSAGPMCCSDTKVCTERFIELGIKLPYDLIKAYEDRLNPAKVLADLRKAIEDALGFKMPTCPEPTPIFLVDL